MQENELLATLPELFASGDDSVVVGSGPDDCAHVRTGCGGVISLSADAFAEGSHFLPDTPARDVARKALGASLSDLAASGCRARWALVTLCLRKGAPENWAAEFADALAEAAKEYAVAIVGGDVVSSPNGTSVGVTVVGEPLSPRCPILRGGGQAGDALIVTGSLGGSLRGKHLDPIPRFGEMKDLVEFCQSFDNALESSGPDAAIDISDGLALDLSRLARESGVGAVILENLIPISDAAREMAAESGKTPLQHALADGEDFELLVAVPPAVWDAYAARQDEEEAAGSAGVGFTRIGSLTGGKELIILDAEGQPRQLAPEGFVHSW